MAVRACARGAPVAVRGVDAAAAVTLAGDMDSEMGRPRRAYRRRPHNTRARTLLWATVMGIAVADALVSRVAL